jgi:hypothetical protein
MKKMKTPPPTPYIDTLPKRKRRQATETAFHEAGHAVVAFRLGARQVRRVTIVPSGDTLGCVHESPWSMSLWEAIEYLDNYPAKRLKLENEIVVLLAGREAAKRWSGRYNNLGARFDFDTADHYALKIVGGDTAIASAYLRYLVLVAKSWINQSLTWEQIEAVAQELLVKGTLSGKRVGQIINEVVESKIPKFGIEYV